MARSCKYAREVWSRVVTINSFKVIVFPVADPSCASDCNSIAFLLCMFFNDDFCLFQRSISKLWSLCKAVHCNLIKKEVFIIDVPVLLQKKSAKHFDQTDFENFGTEGQLARRWWLNSGSPDKSINSKSSFFVTSLLAPFFRVYSLHLKQASSSFKIHTSHQVVSPSTMSSS